MKKVFDFVCNNFFQIFMMLDGFYMIFWKPEKIDNICLLAFILFATFQIYQNAARIFSLKEQNEELRTILNRIEFKLYTLNKDAQ